MRAPTSTGHRLTLTLLFAGSMLLGSVMLVAAPVAVRHTEGVVHGFLVVRTLDGMAIADGDLTQVARGTRVTSRLVFHFKDGSSHDETAVFSQRNVFCLISYHLVQKGPAFPRSIEMPPDVANGLILTLLKNVAPSSSTSLSYVAATPKPRVVKLNVSASGEERFATGGESRKAMHYVLKVDIGGLSGLGNRRPV